MAIPWCLVSRYAAAWAESLNGALNGHQCWAILCQYRYRVVLAEMQNCSGVY